MSKNQRAEAHILDRVMHLLEEGSVARLMQEDEKFARDIVELYEIVHDKSARLRGSAT